MDHDLVQLAKARLDADSRSLRAQEDAVAALRQSVVEAAAAAESARLRERALRTELGTAEMRYWALRVDVDTQRLARARLLMSLFPVELLRAIFLLCISQPDETWELLDPWPTAAPITAQHNKSRTATPLRLATVCGRWRSVALATPEMWCYIGVPTLYELPEVHAAALHARVLAFLDRSRRRPLHVLLSWAVKSATWAASPYYSRIVTALEGHCARWERVRMAFPDETPQSTYDIFRHPTPMLVEFDMLDPLDVYPGHPTPRPTYLPYCPRLRSLTSHTLFVVPRRPLPGLAILSATTMTVPLQAVWDTLRMMPALEVLEIKFHGHVPDEPPPNTAIPLRCLKRLAISGDLEQFRLWLPFLDMPSVNELWIFADSTPIIVEALDILADRITTLLISDDSDDYHIIDEDIPLIMSLTRLQTLTFYSCSFIDPSFFSGLETRGSDVLPNLSLLQLDYVKLEADSAEALSSLLQATALPPDVTEVSTAESPRCHLKVEAINCDIPSWLETQIKFAAATMDGRPYDPVIEDQDPSSDACITSPESEEEEEAQFTDGSGEDYTSDGEWSDSSPNDDEAELDGHT